MGFLFGSTDEGYRPKASVERLGSELEQMARTGGATQRIAGYELGGKKGFGNIGQKMLEKAQAGQLSQKDLDKAISGGYIKPRYEAAEPAYKPTFERGESGFDVMQAYKPQEFKPFQFTTPDVSDRYRGIESQAIEGAKTGLQAGIEQTMAATGRRGLSPRSGIAGRALGDVAQKASRDISGIRRDIGLQREKDLQQRQAMQAQQNLAAAQFGAGERQFAQQQALRQALGQAQLDAAARGERMGFQRQPMEDLFRLYGMQMPAATRDVQKPGLLSGLGQLGQAAYGIGTGIGAMRDPMAAYKNKAGV